MENLWEILASIWYRSQFILIPIQDILALPLGLFLAETMYHIKNL